MADVLPTPVPLTDSEAKLLRDSEEALKRSRELLAEIETLLAFQHYRPAVWIKEKGPSPDSEPNGAYAEKPRRCGKPS